MRNNKKEQNYMTLRGSDIVTNSVEYNMLGNIGCFTLKVVPMRQKEKISGKFITYKNF